MKPLESIFKSFPITSEEYQILDKKFGDLCHYAAWQLKKKNSKNSMTNEQEDDVQELRIALIRAGCYYKRQTFIENCFLSLEKSKNEEVLKTVAELKQIWIDRRKPGANKQKFGKNEEDYLEKLVKKHVTKSKRPSRLDPLNVDLKFITYCKQIIWNAQKYLGKQITKEKSWRTGLVSLSEFDYLSSC